MKTMEVLPDKMKDSVFEDLWKVLDIYSLPEDEQVRYEREHKIEADRRNIKASYERRIKEAEDIAKAEQEKVKAEQEKVKAEQEKVKAEQEKVKAEREKVKAEQEKVKAEREKVKEMARTMKSAGMPMDVIAQASGLGVEEIAAL
jgi:membrane protein involved in colicin uptake